jgi:predicted molibdopterin-dependent oxidoreductase YjgC
VGTERIIGTKRLYADGKFNSTDGKATFLETKWRGLQAPGKESEKNKWPFLINNGRTNHVRQSAYLDQQNDFVMDRWPYPFIQMNPQDMAARPCAEDRARQQSDGRHDDGHRRGAQSQDARSAAARAIDHA